MEYMPSYQDSLYMDIRPSYTGSLMHYGVKGMKWGIRRYQNPDGTWKKKAAIGSVKRVRQKQEMFRSKIAADGILGKGDASTIRRNTINDRRRGRIAALEQKARNREARDALLKNPSKENWKRFAKTSATRFVTNNSFGNQIRGTYHRKRSEGHGIVDSVARTAFKTYNPTTAAIGMVVENADGTTSRYRKSLANQRKKSRKHKRSR